MAPFETIFPTFLQKCAELHDLLQVVAFMLFIVGTMLFVLHGFSAKTMTLHLVRIMILTALLVMLPTWGNQVQGILQSSILPVLQSPELAESNHVARRILAPPPRNQSWRRLTCCPACRPSGLSGGRGAPGEAPAKAARRGHCPCLSPNRPPGRRACPPVCFRRHPAPRPAPSPGTSGEGEGTERGAGC